MSIINDFQKLAGVVPTSGASHKSTLVTESKTDMSPEELKQVRAAVITTLKSLEKEARDTQRPALTKLYKQDADVYDAILDLVMKNRHEAAKKLWNKQDTGCRDHVFDMNSDAIVKKALTDYFGVAMLKETAEMIVEEEQFYIVLPASANSELSDIVSKVSATSLKNIILGSPKNEIKDIAIFPSSAKSKAHALAQTRWHDAREAPEDEEVVKESAETEALARSQGRKAARSGGGNPYDKKTNPHEYNEWLDGFDEEKADRRGGYSKEMTESEQLDEISKKTLASYAKKAVDDVSYNSFTAGEKDIEDPSRLEHDKKAFKRQKGVEKAVDKLTKESFTEKEANDPWIKGRKSNSNSDGESGSNPYKPGTPNYKQWQQGWDEAEADNKKKYNESVVEDLGTKDLNEEEYAGGTKVEITSGKYKGEKGHISYDEDGEQWIVIHMMGHTHDLSTANTKFKVLKENTQKVEVTTLADEQESLEKEITTKDPSNSVPPTVFSDINKKLKEVAFRIDHLSHIDPSYQEHGYWARFIVEMNKIVDMLKQGTDESFKEAATKLQTFENVALAEVPASLWKFLSVDMYKTPEQRKPSLSARFQEVKYGKGE